MAIGKPVALEASAEERDIRQAGDITLVDSVFLKGSIKDGDSYLKDEFIRHTVCPGEAVAVEDRFDFVRVRGLMGPLVEIVADSKSVIDRETETG